MLFPKNPKIPSNNTDVAAERNIGRPPQAGAAAHACTEFAVRKSPHREFRPLRHSPLLFRAFNARLPASELSPPRGEAARRTKGARGELFPPLP